MRETRDEIVHTWCILKMRWIDMIERKIWHKTNITIRNTIFVSAYTDNSRTSSIRWIRLCVCVCVSVVLEMKMPQKSIIKKKPFPFNIFILIHRVSVIMCINIYLYLYIVHRAPYFLFDGMYDCVCCTMICAYVRCVCSVDDMWQLATKMFMLHSRIFTRCIQYCAYVDCFKKCWK